MQTRHLPRRARVFHLISDRQSVLCTFLLMASICAVGCDDRPRGQGPGHREQPLALSPAQELQIGREAFHEILERTPPLTGGPDLERVTRVSQRIAKAAQIEPLQREINLRLADYEFEWEYCVLKNDQVNAFCLPGGKIVVLTGLMRTIQTDDQLAAVIAHEVAHALAHHASERVARERTIGHGLLSLSYNRKQESEADHIGIFLMTFAGYDPQQAVVLWQKMMNAGQNQVHLPEFLSDHPNDGRRMEQLQAWVAPARAAKKALDEGRVAPAVQHR
ncbi:MAG: peptidase Ste24p [Planctomycetaceae bacterium]|nr:peptidase Ste24p [Planctomycetaceae bacterium]